MRIERRSTCLFGLLALLLGLALVQPALAQETVGAVSGTVTDDSGGALPGVAVTITNSATGVSQRTDSDNEGRYRFVALNVGTYKLTAQLEGFQTVESEVDVSVGSTRTINLQMPLGAVEDTIVVTSDVPLIDVTSTVGGVTVRTDKFAERIPIPREAAQVALVAPGTTTGDTAFNSEDRAYTPGQQVVSIGGASVAENTYLVNGLNITNFRNGVGGSNVPFEFIQEVQVKTGGYEAEFGRSTGGVLNMVTKSGSNQFTGGVNVYWQPESLQEQSPNYYNGFNQNEEFDSTEANLYLGGPIWKDKVFFFGFYQYNDVSTQTISGLLTNGLANARDEQRTRDDPYYGGKLDFNVTASHRVEATYFTDQVTVGNGVFQGGVSSGTGNYDAGGDNLIGKYTGIFGSSFVLSGQYGNNKFDRIALSTSDGSPACYDSTAGGLDPCGDWVNFTIGIADDEREAYRVDADVFVGDHSIRGGLDDETNTSNDLTTYSGGEYFRFFIADEGDFGQPAGTSLIRYRIFEGGGSFETLSNAFYLQDSWEITDRILLNLGLRVEEFDNRNALGESFIKKSDQYAPRIGFVYDLQGDGRSKLFANYGRYHLYIASNTNIRLAGAELFTEDWYTGLPGCDFNNASAGSCLGTLLEANVFGSGEVPDVRETKSDNVDPMYQDEYSIGYERLVGDNWSVGARAVHRSFGEIIEDITIDAALIGLYGDIPSGHNEYRLVNPGTDFSGFAVDPDGNLVPVAFSAAELGYPAPERDYYAVELTFNRRFSDNWMFQGSYVWSHSYGNYEGYVRSDNGQDDAGITTLYDFAGLLDGANGNLPNDRRHNLKLFGAYRWESGFFMGASATYRDGRPLNAFGVHPTDENAQAYGSESFFNQGVLTPRGTVGRTDDIVNFDLTGKYELDLGSTTLTFRADVFNIFDSDTKVEFNEGADEDVTTFPAPVNEFYLQATRFQAPRRVRLSVGLRF